MRSAGPRLLALLAALAVLAAAGVRSSLCQSPSAPAAAHAAAPAASPAAVVNDQIAEARKQLTEAEAAHPGLSPEIASALILLTQRQRVARQITPETHTLADRCLRVAEAAAGRDSILYARALSEMAKLDLAEDRGEQGRPLAEQALAIARTAAPGTLTLAEVADALNKVCYELSDLPCAVRAAAEAVEAIRAAKGDNALYLASMLQGLSMARDDSGDQAGARQAMMESIEIAAKSPPKPATAVLESNAGSYLVHVGDLDQAQSHLNRAMELSIALYGAESIQVAYPTAALADVYRAKGNLPEALAASERALALHRRWYGPSHTRTAGLEWTTARLLARLGRDKEASDLALNAHRTYREYATLAMRVLPERQALAISTQGADALDLAMTLASHSPPVGIEEVYQEEIRSRALVAEEMARRQASINRENDPEVGRLLDRLNRERAEMLGSASAGAGKREAYSDATARLEYTERALAEKSLVFRTAQRTAAVSLDDLRRRLPADAVLISYVHFRRFPGGQIPAKNAAPAYLAFVLRGDRPGIRAFDLGDGKSIDALVDTLRASADSEAHSGGLGATRNERLYRATGEALRQRIWDPLRAETTGARLALVVADGSLNLVPLSGLPEGPGYLVEHGPVVHMLSSERDLVPSEGGKHKEGLLAIGSPRFGGSPSGGALAALPGAGPSCESFASMRFPPLPGTAEELTGVGAAWRRWNSSESASLFLGAEATRGRFLSEASQHRVLHVATHAFLLDPSCGEGNPLLRSGLVFAGANQGREAAVVTAQQIAALDLGGVDWAVLSACNTGNGELKDSEGVLGLERAFRVAGAHSVIMALWPVDDRVTRDFMRALYTERLRRKATTADSVWAAARTMLAARRAAGASTHPWYWAGFIGAGGWE